MILTGACWQVDRVGGGCGRQGGPISSATERFDTSSEPRRGIAESARVSRSPGIVPSAGGRQASLREAVGGHAHRDRGHRAVVAHRRPLHAPGVRHDRERRGRDARRGLELEGQRPRHVAVLTRLREHADARNAARAHPAVVVEAGGQPVGSPGQVRVDQHDTGGVDALHVPGDPKPCVGDALDDVGRERPARSAGRRIEGDGIVREPDRARRRRRRSSASARRSGSTCSRTRGRARPSG